MRKTILIIFFLLIFGHSLEADAQAPIRRFTVEGGIKREIAPEITDSLNIHTALDSLEAESLGLTLSELDSLRVLQREDSIRFASIQSDTVPEDGETVLSRRQQRRLDRQEKLADPDFVRHNKFFRDSIPISRVTAYSLILPGYAQLYNNQAWKIPVLYGTVGTTTYFWQRQQKEYKKVKKEYDALVRIGASREEIDPIQSDMIRKNTVRQILMVGAIGSYIYFIGDGAVNYPGNTTSVKKATTLSTIFPGAGQIYNKSYWKVPIVMGGFATMAMVIDWNNRGYKRFKLAYDIRTDGNEDTKDEFADYPGVTETTLKNLKNSYRRNRDLSIILTGAVYLLNIIDAHVDAHMKDYDVSDDLTFNFEPAVTNFYTMSGRGSKNLMGFTFRITF